MGRPCTLGDEQFDLVGFDELTMNEQSEIQKLTGLRGFALEEARLNADIDVTMAVIYISIKRQRPDVTMEEIGAHNITDVKLVEDDAGPPASTPPVDGTSGGDTSRISGLETLAS